MHNAERRMRKGRQGARAAILRRPALSLDTPYGGRARVTFGDIWCQLVSFGPAPHIYQRVTWELGYGA